MFFGDFRCVSPSADTETGVVPVYCPCAYALPEFSLRPVTTADVVTSYDREDPDPEAVGLSSDVEEEKEGEETFPVDSPNAR